MQLAFISDGQQVIAAELVFATHYAKSLVDQEFANVRHSCKFHPLVGLGQRIGE